MYHACTTVTQKAAEGDPGESPGRLRESRKPPENHASRPASPPDCFLPSSPATGNLPRSARHLYKGSFPGSRHPQHQETHGELGSPGSLELCRSRGRRHLSLSHAHSSTDSPTVAAFRAAIGRRIRPLAFRAAIGRMILPAALRATIGRNIQIAQTCWAPEGPVGVRLSGLSRCCSCQVGALDM